MEKDVAIELTDAPDERALKSILDGLRSFNAGEIGASDLRKLAVLIRKDAHGEVVGGLSGHTIRGWLYVDMLFVPDELRGKGLAAQLLSIAETEAVRRNCRAAWLDTINPKALELYERLGYRIFGELPDFADGRTCYYLQKRLAAV